MANKKKHHGGLKQLYQLLFFIAFVTYFNSYSVNANYVTNQVSETDIEEICVAIGCPYNSNTVASRTTALNQLLIDKDVNLANIVFYTDLTSLYAIIQNGSAGNDELPILCLYQQGNIITIRQHQGFIYSGDNTIIGVNPATYITKYLLSPSGGTYTESNGNIRIYNYLNYEQGIVTCPVQITATWGYNAVATWSGDNYIGFRNLRPYKELSNWVVVVPTSTPTPTPTQAQPGSVDLTETNQKIDNVNESINNLIEQISGDNQQIINELTEVPDLSGESISSGDIESALGFEVMHDPYENFWLTFSVGLGSALVDVNRELDYNLPFASGTIDLDQIGFNIPESLKWLLTSVSTTLVVWLIVKWWKIIIDNISSGNMDEVLALNEEEGYTDLF